MWLITEINTMCGYPDVYLKTGTLFLADVIEKFINTCLEYYGFRSLSFFLAAQH